MGVATFVPRPYAGRPGVAGVQLRGMAVETELHGRGIGELLLTMAMEQLRARGTKVLWAKARDSALGFYERLGMHVEGEGFITEDTLLPHHTVVVELS